MAYTAKLQVYYDLEIRDHINDDAVLLKGLSTLLTIDYYIESPLYQYVSDSGDYQFTLSSYAIGISYGDAAYDGYMFVVNDIQIKEHGEVVLNPIMKLSVTLNDQTLLVDSVFSDTGSVYYDPVKPFSIYNVPALFLFDAENYLLVPSTDEGASPEFTTIEHVTLEYSNGKTNDKSEYVFNDIPLFVGSKVEYRDAAYIKDPNFFIDASKYQIRDNFESISITQNDIDTFNLMTEKDDLSPYNGEVWKIMSIYVFSIAVITYFLFFHKLVRLRIAEKKHLANKEKKGNSTEVIFKDIDDN